MKQTRTINFGDFELGLDNYFCDYLDNCGTGKINEKCFRDYTECKTYQINLCWEQRREEKKKQLNLEKMILNLKKRIE